MKQQREFCFIPIKCGCSCHQEIPLNPKRLHQYEKRGYPTYIQGHQHFSENNVMKRPEVKAKIIGRKRPDFSEFNKTRTGSKNPNFGNHTLFSQKHKERISEGLKKYHQRKKQEQIKPLPSMVPVNENSSLSKKFEKIIKNNEKKLGYFSPGEIVSEKIVKIEPKPEIKPILSYDEQLKIALRRVQQNRENNIKQRKSEPIIETEEDNAYSDRIKELVGKFGDPEKKEKHFIKPLWVVKSKVKK